MKIRRELEDVFFKPIIVSTADTDIFVEKEMLKKRLLVKKSWYD